MQQYEIGLADSIFVLNFAFRWPKRRTGVWLYDGVGELDLGSVADVYAASGTDQTYTLASAESVDSRHGLQFVPRWRVQNVPAMDRLLVAGSDGAGQAANRPPAGLGGVGVTVKKLRNDGFPDFAYGAALEDLACEQDAWTATFAAKRLEVRTPLHFVGQKWPIHVLLAPLLVGCVALACSGSAHFLSSVGLALIGAAICISGVVSFRLARTTVNPNDARLRVLRWAVFLSNALALAFIPAFVVYMNRFQIGPEERALASLFAHEYSAYNARVRRCV